MMRYEATMPQSFKGWMATCLILLSSVGVGTLIVLVPAPHLSFLVLGLLAVALLGLRPNWYVLGFWAITTTGEALTTGVTSVDLSLGGLRKIGRASCRERGG